jgi:hypothetical protein
MILWRNGFKVKEDEKFGTASSCGKPQWAKQNDVLNLKFVGYALWGNRN